MIVALLRCTKNEEILNMGNLYNFKSIKCNSSTINDIYVGVNHGTLESAVNDLLVTTRERHK